MLLKCSTLLNIYSAITFQKKAEKSMVSVILFLYLNFSHTLYVKFKCE